MGLSSQRVPEKEANWQRSLLHRGDQNHLRQRVRCGVPGERCAPEPTQMCSDCFLSLSRWLPVVSVRGCDSGAQLDRNHLLTLVFFSRSRHDGGEHRRVFSQRGSGHSPQGRNQREHVRMGALNPPLPVLVTRSPSMLVVVLISQRLRCARKHLECVVY